MNNLTISEIERLIEAIEEFGEYFDDWEILDSAKRKLEKKLQNTSDNSNYMQCQETIVRNGVKQCRECGRPL